MNINGKEWLSDVHRTKEEKNTRFDKLRLDKNEWISEFPNEIMEVIKNKLRVEHILAYPETYALYSKIAEHHHLTSENIVITTGIDGGIRNCFDLFVNQNSKVVTVDPTFAMVEIYCQLYNAQQIKIKYNSKLELDVENLLTKIESDVSLLIIANPNSPTGTIIPREVIQLILKRAKANSVPVLIDEAYYGFYPETTVDLVSQFPNLIVARTFSKAFGMAGCRVGYLVSNQTVAQNLLKFRSMYEVNSFALLIAETMLENHHFVQEYCDKVSRTKKILVNLAINNEIPVVNTHTNFLHFDFGKNKQNVIKNLESSEILVKGGIKVQGYENYLRVSIGPLNAFSKVIEVMNKYGKT